MNPEITTLIEIIRRESINTDINDISACNIGSAHKSKDEIINDVCSKAREASAFLSYCMLCLEYLAAGWTFDKFVEAQTLIINDTTYHISSRQHAEKLLVRLFPEMIDTI